MSLLEVRDLVVEHRSGLLGRSSSRVLDGVDLNVDEGEAVGLMGPSGCGKTTLARAVMRLIRPSSGSIVLMGREIARARRLDWMATEMQMVFQDPMAAMDPRMTLRESMLEPVRLAGMDEAPLWDLAGELNIDDELLDRYPWQLSGGQVQRASLARVLALEPRLLILDEATSMLDVLVQAQVMDVVSRQRSRMSLLMISHSGALLDAVCDRTVAMRDGIIVDR